MTLELLDESKIKKSCIKTDVFNVVTVKKSDKEKKPKLALILKEDIVECERVRLGMVDNCALCQNSNKEMFDRCKNKYSGV